MKLVPNLYALRLILAVFVVLFHVPLVSQFFGLPYFNDWPIFHKGLISVYYFFTLSGFLIIRLIYNQLKSAEGFSLKAFYLRRVQRLYPVYYLVLLIGILFYHVLFPLLEIDFFIDYKLSDLLLHYVFFIPNVFTRINPDIGLILLVLWSIGIEEQFYLFIPLLLLLFKKNVLWFLGLLLLVSLLLLFFYESFYFYNNYYFYFISGGLMAILNLKKKIRLFESMVFHILVYLLFVLVFFTSYFDSLSFYLFHSLHLVVSTLLIGLIADYPKFIIQSRVLNYWGQISYGIYMYHPIVITGMLLIIEKTKVYLLFNQTLYIVLVNIVILGISILLAHLSFKYLEVVFYRSKFSYWK